jgi:hypothetical protein
MIGTGVDGSSSAAVLICPQEPLYIDQTSTDKCTKDAPAKATPEFPTDHCRVVEALIHKSDEKPHNNSKYYSQQKSELMLALPRQWVHFVLPS